MIYLLKPPLSCSIHTCQCAFTEKLGRFSIYHTIFANVFVRILNNYFCFLLIMNIVFLVTFNPKKSWCSYIFTHFLSFSFLKDLHWYLFFVFYCFNVELNSSANTSILSLMVSFYVPYDCKNSNKFITFLPDFKNYHF